MTSEQPGPQPVAAQRRVWCNRTLNLRSIGAIGYDMDYTLVHYRTEAWERAAFQSALRPLGARGWPVEGLTFDPTGVIQGLAFDLELGNLVKATRFGYVIQAHHGTRPLSFEALRETYSGTLVELSEPRWEFMNTLFSLSEASLFAQLVDKLDSGDIAENLSYRELHRILHTALDEAHSLGELKTQIAADPDRFVVLDEEMPLALLDQKQAGKRLLLVTNSDWAYSCAMMTYALDRFLPSGTTWRNLFDLVIVEARKPAFFSGRHAVYRMVDEERGWLEPHRGALQAGGVYVGGDAALVEMSLELSGAQLLYVGDHLFGDVHVSKDMLRWRTGLILREIEPEIRALVDSRQEEQELKALMSRKVEIENRISQLRLCRQRHEFAANRQVGKAEELETAVEAAVNESIVLDEQIAPLAKAFATLGNPNWGPLMRAGSDKSLFARQVERYADVYTSRVSNFLAVTPFAYLRAARGSLPHDPA